MKRLLLMLLMVASFACASLAQERRPIDNRHPMWIIHIDVWNNADPQKIIDLIPDDIKPYVCLNLSMSCAYDTDLNIYKKPQSALQTYRSWATVCCRNNMWFTCQPASGGHTHINDKEEIANGCKTFEQFFIDFKNFLGWNYAEQFWGFNEAGDASSASDADRIALFAKLVPMHHKYGGFLTISFCGNIWSHWTNPVGMMKRNAELLSACESYPEAVLFLYKYTTSANWNNNESVTLAPFISGLAKNYGVRYDNCGWNGAIDEFCKNDGKTHTYPGAVGIAPVMEQMTMNGACVWDGPELIWTECFKNLSNTTVDGYTHRNWGTYENFDNIWVDMFRKVINGDIYIPTREEVVARTKVAIENDISEAADNTGLKVNAFAAPIDLYNGLYLQDNDVFNSRTTYEGGIGNVAGYGNNNYLYFKKTGRYQAIPMYIPNKNQPYIPNVVKRSTINAKSGVWANQSSKVNWVNSVYPEISTGDLFVARNKNVLTCYFPYSYMNPNRTKAQGSIPLKYNTCSRLDLSLGKFSTVMANEYSDHIDFYLNNFRADTTDLKSDVITIVGAKSKPTYTLTKRTDASKGQKENEQWNASTGTYSITISHCGSFDLTIYCSGNNTSGRATDVVRTDALNAADIKQPDFYVGDLTIEAEDMDYKSVQDCVTDQYNSQYRDVRGHSAMGFQRMGTNKNGALRWKGKMNRDGLYTVSIKYKALSDCIVKSSLNGTEKSLTLKATSPVTDSEWGIVEYEAEGKKGDNEFTLSNTGGVDFYVDNVTFKPMTDVLDNAGGNQHYDSSTGRYYYTNTQWSAFTSDVLLGQKVSDIAELIILCEDGVDDNGEPKTTVGYRLDFEILDAQGNVVKDWVIGEEKYGTRSSSPIINGIYDIQSLEPLSQYANYYFGRVRLNTAAPTASDTDYYLTLKSIKYTLMGNITATKTPVTNLNTLHFAEHNMPGNGSFKNEIEYDCHIGASAKEVENGGVVYGKGGVNNNEFVDLSRYTTLTLTGTASSDRAVRLLLNRAKESNGNSPSWVEIRSDGNITVNLLDLAKDFGGKVFLHAIKVDREQSCTIASATVTDALGNVTNLADLPYGTWDVKNAGEEIRTFSGNNFALNTPVTAGNVVASPDLKSEIWARNYIDLAAYTTMEIKGNGGPLRLVFNKGDAGEDHTIVTDLTEEMFYEWDNFDATASQVGSAGCDFVFGQSTGQPYGTSNVNGSMYADLTEYNTLKLTVTDGTPRLLLNRPYMGDSGQADYLEIKDSNSKYANVNGNEWSIDLDMIKDDYGYVHLNAIKGANWANVTITEAKLYSTGQSDDIAYTGPSPVTEMTVGFANGTAKVDLPKNAHLNAIVVADGGSAATVTEINLTNNSLGIADYYLHGSGHETASLTGALADDNATVIDATDMNNKANKVLESINPNCLFMQTADNNLQGTRNLVTRSANSTYTADKIELVDKDMIHNGEHPFFAPNDITVSDASYSRTLANGIKWGTAVIPFKFVVGEGSPDIYVLKQVSSDKMTFTLVERGTEMPANSTVVYQSDDANVLFTGHDIKATPDGWNIQPIADGPEGWYMCQSFTGVKVDVSTDDFLKDYYVYGINGNTFKHITRNMTTHPFRAFFLHKKSGGNAPAPTFLIDVDDNESTAIDSTSAAAPATELDRYDATGRRVHQPIKGVNIIRMSDGTVRKEMIK